MILSAFIEETPETRVAIVPRDISHYQKLGLELKIEKNAGKQAGFSDESYTDAQAEIISNKEELIKKSDVILSLTTPPHLDKISSTSLLIMPVDPVLESPIVESALKSGFSLFSTNLIPRVSRAQSMDMLSSQASISGYRAFLEAVFHYERAIPLMMTAAGTISSAKVLVMGAGVAGLQAIATAKRLGAEVYAFDVRHDAKEQVESLGGRFIEVDTTSSFQNEGGYAKETDAQYQKKQEGKIRETLQKMDIVICTALIPNKKAPVLLKKDMILEMKQGSIIVDIATSRGGNTELSKPNETICTHGITIIGLDHAATLIPTTASELLSHNFLQILRFLMNKEGTLQFNSDDEIVKAALLCHQGKFFPFKG